MTQNHTVISGTLLSVTRGGDAVCEFVNWLMTPEATGVYLKVR